MARPTKQGIDYFPLDVGFFEDIKIRRLKKDCGNQAISILIAILCIIYRDEGYYVGINSDLTFLIAEMFGISEDAVLETVRKTVDVGIFDSQRFHKYEILTSRGIQERYITAAKQKKVVYLVSEYLLNSVSIPVNGVTTDVNGIISADNEQSKGKGKGKCKGKGISNAPTPEGLQAPEEESAVISLTLNTKEEFSITEAMIKEFETLYPAVDIEQDLRNMKGWLNANPERRKTKNGIMRFINRWLSKTQDSGGNKGKPNQSVRNQGKSDNVGNFKQRQYSDEDYSKFYVDIMKETI